MSPASPPAAGWELTRARMLADTLDRLRAAGEEAAEETGRRLEVLLRHPSGVREGMLPVLAALLVDAGVISGLVRSGIAERTQAAAAEEFRRRQPGDDAEVERAARAVGATARMTLLARHLTAPQHTIAVLARTAELTQRLQAGRLDVGALFSPAVVSDLRSAAMARAAAAALRDRGAEMDRVARAVEARDHPHEGDHDLAARLRGLATLPGASAAPTVWPGDPGLVAWLRSHTYAQLYTWGFEEMAARRWIGGDLYGIRTLPAAPPFLAMTDTRTLPPALLAPLFRRLSLTRPAPDVEELTPEALADDPGPVTTVRRSAELRHWGQPAGTTPPLPDDVTIPHLLHGIWLGGPLPATNPFWANYATAATRYSGRLDVILWVDVPRSQIGRPEHRDLLTWARRYGIHLVNVHEVFHATAPMTLHTPYTLEGTKRLPRGHAAASDHLRIDVMHRFGGIYADGDMAFDGGPREATTVTPVDAEVPAGPHPDYPTWRGRWPIGADQVSADGPVDLMDLLALVAGSVPGFTLNGMGDAMVSNDAIVAPAGHPAMALWLECSRVNYFRAQTDLFGGVAALATGTEPDRRSRRGRPSAWTWSVTPARSGRTHHAMLRRLRLRPGDLPGMRPAIWPSNDLSWLPPGGGEATVPPPPEDDGDMAPTLMRCVSYLRWQLFTRCGNLHLSAVAPHVRGLRDPDTAWTALLLALAALPGDVPAVTSVTDVRRNADGSLDRVELPPRAEALLDRSATPAGWLGADHAVGREVWLLDERITPVALRGAAPAGSALPEAAEEAPEDAALAR